MNNGMNVDTGWDWSTILGWVVVAGGICIAIYKAIMYRYKRTVAKAVNSGLAAEDLEFIKKGIVDLTDASKAGAKQLALQNKKLEGHNRRLLRIEQHLKLKGYGDKD